MNGEIIRLFEPTEDAIALSLQWDDGRAITDDWRADATPLEKALWSVRAHRQRVMGLGDGSAPRAVALHVLARHTAQLRDLMISEAGNVIRFPGR